MAHHFIEIRGLSSAGRAPALHAGGQRFDPARLHHYTTYYYLTINYKFMVFFYIAILFFVFLVINFIRKLTVFFFLFITSVNVL